MSTIMGYKPPSPPRPEPHNLVMALVHWRSGMDISKCPFDCVSAAGIKLDTIAVAHDLFGSFKIGDIGRKRVQRIIDNLDISIGLQLHNKLIEGTSQPSVTDKGLLMMAICGSLVKFYGLLFTVNLLNEMHRDADRRPRPSTLQWERLLRPFQRFDLCLIRIEAGPPSRACNFVAEEASSFDLTPVRFAEALRVVGKLSQGQLQSVEMVGDESECLDYIVFLRERLFDLLPKIRNRSGALIYCHSFIADLATQSMWETASYNIFSRIEISMFHIFRGGSENQFYPTEKDVPFIRDTATMEGRGTFAIVYRATTLNGVFAVKRLDKVYGEKKRAIVYKEVDLLRQCSHPNLLHLIQMYQVETQPNTFFLVTSPWAPDTLHDFINLDDAQRESIFPWYQQGSPESDRQIKLVLFGLTNGLSRLHLNGIKHKDIKPSNILLFREQEPDLTKKSNPWGVRPIIADFGVSKPLKPDSSTNFTDSTYDYLAPEQVHHVESTPKSDVFAMGCCFANILAIFCAGSRGRVSLLDAITEDNRSCQYARELDHVKAAMKDICSGSSYPSRNILYVVQAMLKAKPSERPESSAVRDHLRVLGLETMETFESTVGELQRITERKQGTRIVEEEEEEEEEGEEGEEGEEEEGEEEGKEGKEEASGKKRKRKDQAV